ncbi:unnamed protein product, partial [marine sediment metagenome]
MYSFLSRLPDLQFAFVICAVEKYYVLLGKEEVGSLLQGKEV